MKKTLFFSLILLLSLYLNSQELSHQNYLTIYGEGPVGRHVVDFEVRTYQENEAVLLAKEEMSEFLSAMLYGYTFVYKVENKKINHNGYFQLDPILKLNLDDPAVRLRQFQSSSQFLRFQVLYQLNQAQKSYLNGFLSARGKAGIGEAVGKEDLAWEGRFSTYQEALKNAVLIQARKKYKARPLFITGKLLLKESPKIYISSGQWRINVKIHLIFNHVRYQDSY